MQVTTILFNFLNWVIFVDLTFFIVKKNLKRTRRWVDRLGMNRHQRKGGVESVRRG